MAPPFMGAPSALKVPFGLDNLQLINGFGLNFRNLLGMISWIPSIYQLVPKKIWDFCEDQKWIMPVHKRIMSDVLKLTGEPIDPNNPSPMDIFPRFGETCGKDFSERLTKNCDLGIRFFNEFGSIAGEELSEDSISEMLKTESSFLHASDIYEMVQDERFNELDNPGV